MVPSKMKAATKKEDNYEKDRVDIRWFGVSDFFFVQHFSSNNKHEYARRSNRNNH